MSYMDRHSVERDPRATLTNSSSVYLWPAQEVKRIMEFPPWQRALLYQDSWFIAIGLGLEIQGIQEVEQINLRDFPVIKLPLKKNQLTADRFASRTRDGTKPVSESVFHPYGVWDLEIDFFLPLLILFCYFLFFFWSQESNIGSHPCWAPLWLRPWSSSSSLYNSKYLSFPLPASEQLKTLQTCNRDVFVFFCVLPQCFVGWPQVNRARVVQGGPGVSFLCHVGHAALLASVSDSYHLFEAENSSQPSCCCHDSDAQLP